MGRIVVDRVGKAFRHYPSRWGRLKEWLLPGHRVCHSLHWVLQDISFEVAPGECVGIVGMNGAGKSTLLKMIAGTLTPTRGAIAAEGSIVALLELGMGFHPDFTGRQNVYMAAQLLGHETAAIDAAMPEIEAFAEIGAYLDEPVRVYSSGMQMRLAFSVATAFRPDVLIVDEALSVGDAYFQHKSFDRIRQFRDQGTTLLLVSHDKAAIQSICNRAVLLDGGRLAMQGPPEAVMDYYNALLADREGASVSQITLDDGSVQTISGTGEATVLEVMLTDSEGRPLEMVEVGQPVCLKVTVAVHQPIDRLVLGYSIRDRLGQVVFGTNTFLKDQVLESVPAGQTVVFEIRFPANIGPGSYSVQTALVSTEDHLSQNYEWRDRALIFQMVNLTHSRFEGLTWLDPMIEIEKR
jgi:lipopolysaccharide transport system ATP-binding protein